MLPQITDTALRQLDQAALKIQVVLYEQGIEVSPKQLQSILIQWLESSIESLCEDAVELCLTGDRVYGSFNRDIFSHLLRQSYPAAQPYRSPLGDPQNTFCETTE